MNVLMVIPPEEFRDEEYKINESILTKKGCMVLTASTKVDYITGMFGTVIKADLPLESAKEISFDAIMLIGGNGAKLLWDNAYLHQLLKEFNKKNKLIGAICFAPVTLARAGILRKKRATVHEDVKNEFKEFAVTYTGQSVEEDGKIVTANGPSASNLFGQTFVRILMQNN